MTSQFYYKCVLTLLCCLLNGLSIVNGQDRWSLVTSCDLCGDYNAVAYGNGQWVTVGNNGRIFTSTDAITWVAQRSTTTQSLNDVTYQAGQWVVVGTSGTVLTSPDGVTWTSHSTDPADDLNGVDYGGGLWIAAGVTSNVRIRYSIIFTSTDGITWTEQTAAHQLNNILNKVRYLNGAWYLVGGNGFIASSTDGTTWTPRPQFSTVDNLNSIAYGGGQYIVATQGGRALVSSDGIKWSGAQASSLIVDDISYGDGRWVGVCSAFLRDPVIVMSTDGIHWGPIASPAPNTLFSVRYANGRWVAVGRQLAILTSPFLVPIPLAVASPYTGSVKIYPNPGAYSLTIEAGDTINKITIQSVTGSVLKEQTFNSGVNHWQWETSGMSSGVYLIKIQTSDQRISSLTYIKQ